MSSRTPPPGPLIGGLLRLAWVRVRTHVDAGVRAAGYTDLNPGHLALFRYNAPDGQRPSRLADEMGITKQSVNDLLRHLERTGYAELVPDPDDSRARLVRLTTRGRQLHALLLRHARVVEQALQDAMGDGPFDTLRRTLRAIGDGSLLQPGDPGGGGAVGRRGRIRLVSRAVRRPRARR